MWALLLASVGIAQDEPCSTVPKAELVEALQRADVAWNDLDGTALDNAMVDIRRHVPCLNAPVELRLVLQLHQAHGRHAWTTYDPQASARAWLAVRDLAPEWTDAYDADVAPDHPVRDLWNSRPQWNTTLDEGPPGGWLVDGTPSTEVPLDRAFVLQAMNRRGAVLYSAWHLSAADVPQSPWRAERIKRLRVRGTVLGSVLAVGGGATLVSGVVVRRRAAEVPTQDKVAYIQRSNVLMGTGASVVGASALSMGLLWGVRW